MVQPPIPSSLLSADDNHHNRNKNWLANAPPTAQPTAKTATNHPTKAAAKPQQNKPQGGKILTQHTGLPPKPRADGGGKSKSTPPHKPSNKRRG